MSDYKCSSYVRYLSLSGTVTTLKEFSGYEIWSKYS